MLKTEVKNPQEKFLRKFRVGREMPRLKNAEEKRNFSEFQRFDLIRLGPAGKLRITSKGEYALGVGVHKYISNIRLEKRLFMEYLKGKSQGRWLFFSGLLVTLFFLALISLFSVGVL